MKKVSGIIHVRAIDMRTLQPYIENKTTPLPHAISAKGGLSLAYSVDPDAKTIRVAAAVCSFHDDFDRVRGSAIATGRLQSDRVGRFVDYTFDDLIATAKEILGLDFEDINVSFDEAGTPKINDNDFPLAKLLLLDAKMLIVINVNYRGKFGITVPEEAVDKFVTFERVGTRLAFYLGYSGPALFEAYI